MTEFHHLILTTKQLVVLREVVMKAYCKAHFPETDTLSRILREINGLIQKMNLEANAETTADVTKLTTEFSKALTSVGYIH